MNRTFRNVALISRRELGSYLSSLVPFVVTAIFLVLSGTFFTSYLADTDYADASIRGFLDVAPFLILLFAVMLTMRLLAEERALGTWELLFTSPVRDGEIVIGKYVGSLVMLGAMLALTLYYPLLLVGLGDPDLGPVVTSYVGLLLLGGAALSVGLFASSLTSSQIAAAVVAGLLLFALWFLGPLAEAFGGPVADVLSQISLERHFADFTRGVLDTRAVVHYLSVTAVFLFLATRSVESGRYR